MNRPLARTGLRDSGECDRSRQSPPGRRALCWRDFLNMLCSALNASLTALTFRIVKRAGIAHPAQIIGEAEIDSAGDYLRHIVGMERDNLLRNRSRPPRLSALGERFLRASQS